jgi:short-subunit dehydrogenase
MGKHKGGKGGTEVNIASVAGLGLKTACPVYDGNKFFVVGYSMSIFVSFKK